METKYHNEMIIESFSPEEKEFLFRELMNMFFHKNFGTVSKSDLETFMFSFYLEHLLNSNQAIDDYILGKDLGLTLARIRSLKERKELKYPREGYHWEDAFLENAKNAKYDETHHLVKFTISDVNVLKDVRYYFEKNNQYDEVQLNPKLFACRPDTFIEMCKKIAEEKGEQFSWTTRDLEKIKEYANRADADSKSAAGLAKFLHGAVEEGIKDLLLCGAKEAALAALSCVNPLAGTVAAKALDILTKALQR